MARKPAKKLIVAVVKLNIPGGQASTVPPVGPALAPHGINLMDFIKQYNEATRESIGTIVPVEVTIFNDRSFTFQLRTPPAAVLIKQAAGMEKAAATPGRGIVGTITRQQVRQIAERKSPDLPGISIDSAMRMIEGTARSMGIGVTD